MTPDEQRATAQRIAARFRAPRYRRYAGPKLRLDPVYAAAARVVAASGYAHALLDIGCGIGLLGLYLHERGFRGGYRGLDVDADKIAAAREAARDCGDALRFEDADATAALPAFSGHVALLDVLHYLDAERQAGLLDEASRRVAPGAALIVRNVLREPNWRFRATVAEEWAMHAVGWMRSRARHFPAREDIEAPLRAAGFAVDVRPLWGRTPFNSFAIVARRGAHAAPARA